MSFEAILYCPVTVSAFPEQDWDLYHYDLDLFMIHGWILIMALLKRPQEERQSLGKGTGNAMTN